MSSKYFLKTISFKEASDILKEKIKIVPKTEEISFEHALNRVLAEDIISPIDVPTFDRSLRDGFAVIAKDTFGAEDDSPVILTIIDEIRAGEVSLKVLKSECCMQIATGAPIPEGANAVVMVEFTKRENNSVRIYKAAAPKQFITTIGTDIEKNKIILKKKTLLSPRELGTLAAVGLQRVTVFAKPKVSILSTGNELTSPTEQLKLGKIYDINATTLYNSVLESEGTPLEMGISPDDFKILTEKIKEMITISDVIIITGGTSKGKGDLLPDILSTLDNIELFIHGVRIKPGKPIIISSIKSEASSIPLFVLPGNPTSCLITFNLFIDPLIRRFTYSPQKKSKIIKAKLKKRIYSSEGRTVFQPAKIIDPSAKEIEIIPIHTGSESITTLSHTDGYIIIPEEIQFLEENDIVDFSLF
ncbi:MAG: molybdopterin molybdenumtransferase MoeA [Candidatus Helarchaeota archaeon]|nr:molybdopterin molybdenumtransferase MoeA [Candidatus Helarchaeota archaeon]